MAPRTSTAVDSGSFDRNYLDSSPDPLAGSMDENRGRVRKTRATKQPLTSSSPSKQNRRTSIGELDVSSPSKSMVMSTPRGGGASPWRIRVTVQAEPGTDDENMESPSIKRITRTQTTTVPLKDPDASSPVKRRGRPRKSDAASAKTKRSGTPVKKTRAKSKKRDPGADASAADVDTDAAPKKRRGRPRKSIPVEVDETPAAEEPALNVPQPRVSSEDRIITPSPEPELESQPRIDVPVIETTFATPQDQDKAQAVIPKGKNLLPPAGRKDLDLFRDVAADMRFTPPQTDLSQRVRARKNTPAAKGKVLVEVESDEESDNETDIRTPSGSDDDGLNAQSQRGVMHSDNASTEHVEQIDPPSDDEYDALQDMTGFAFEEGATRMPDDTTIVESEQFSMISVDSLPSSGGLTSPVYGPTGRTPTVPHAAVRNPEFLKVPAAESRQSQSRSSPGPSRAVPSAAPTKSSPVPAAPRYITPLMDERSPSQPPAIEPARLSPTEAKTPKIGPVVKAGVALQGVLDPHRVTPEAGPSRAGESRPSGLDDLFRGFSDRTRKDLQAGLRLGEQLARENASNKGSPAAFSSPIKPNRAIKSNDDVFGNETKKRQPRLLTPEDQDDHALPSPPTTHPDEAQYPSLEASQEGPHLLTPAVSPMRSDDEMSWKVDTPEASTMQTAGGRSMTVTNECGDVLRGKDIFVVADRNSSGEDDIWAEEAGRLTLPDGNATTESPQAQDLFTEDGPSKPARAKLPATWRRKSAANFQYSDESEESPEEYNNDPPQGKVDKGKGKATAVDLDLQITEDEDQSEESDDTGMFFTSNLPNVFNNNKSGRVRRGKAGKVDLTTLMNEGDSLLPDSSPPVVLPADTPPRFPGFQSTPAKSSPLRKEIRASSSPSERQPFEESTLPLPPSSPFHTQVDGMTMNSTASDERQLRDEMGNRTDSSLRKIRNEADDYIFGYEEQDRTLGDIEEVTEQSRTLRGDIQSSALGSRQFGQSTLNPRRATPSSSRNSPHVSSASRFRAHTTPTSPPKTTPKVIAKAPAQSKQAAKPSTGLIGRLSSTIFGSSSTPKEEAPQAQKQAKAPPASASRPTSPTNHPMAFKFDNLPAYEPWTKTHYKTLDALFQLSRLHPELFSTNLSSPHYLINTTLLTSFITAAKLPFIGAVLSAWGYSFTCTEEDVVMCAIFYQLLTLKDVAEYEELYGKRIVMGDCKPGRTRERITRKAVFERYATVVLGDHLREDERNGVRIERDERGLRVQWPSLEETEEE
ncbi:hypothetical protein CC80DRAFT_527752 [Byssothecium circinans]|uniref:Uncharacterized protein n=1 Tax=Byssothecium circinans TaxID=147558 RepID=A0A6A5TI48_9PLEO|nr:hypothetical protein CC80DRAFT_527752 [Byssothecium circinans]